MKTIRPIALLASLLAGCIDNPPQDRTAADGHEIVFRSAQNGPPSHPKPAREMHLTDNGDLLPANHEP